MSAQPKGKACIVPSLWGTFFQDLKRKIQTKEMFFLASQSLLQAFQAS